MKFEKAMRKECVTANGDGTYTVKGAGWFWATISADGKRVLKSAVGMAEKKAARLFFREAKLTVQKHFPE